MRLPLHARPQRVLTGETSRAELDRRQLLEVHERIRLALKPYEATA